MSVDKITNIDTKVSSSISKKRPSTPEAIPLTPIEVEVKVRSMNQFASVVTNTLVTRHCRVIAASYHT